MKRQTISALTITMIFTLAAANGAPEQTAPTSVSSLTKSISAAMPETDIPGNLIPDASFSMVDPMGSDPMWRPTPEDLKVEGVDSEKGRALESIDNAPDETRKERTTGTYVTQSLDLPAGTDLQLKFSVLAEIG